MNETNARITQKEHPPTDSDIEQWIGKNNYQYWNQLTNIINEKYPNIFIPQWLFGGQKHGWSLRYKKSKSFCTFIPEKNRFALVIVFGTKEREKLENIYNSLSKSVQSNYDQAKTYHDGKWLLFDINSSTIIEDIVKLLEIKRKPKKERF